MHECGGQGQTAALSFRLSSCVTLGGLCNLSEPQFPPRHNADTFKKKKKSHSEIGRIKLSLLMLFLLFKKLYRSRKEGLS